MLECEACGEQYEPDQNIQLCGCGEPLRLEYFHGDIKEGKRDVWSRYSEFFPFEIDEKLSLGEGNTPLLKASSISKKLDINLYLKNETVNPTWSFKDRGTILSLQRVIDLGIKKLGTVSTGNMATSVSAYGARNEMTSIVIVPSNISDKKIEQISTYGPVLIKVTGDYGDLYYESLEVGKDKIYFTISNSPFRVEGYKTIAFEIYEEKIPDYVFIPTSSGGLFRGLIKGFEELKKSDVIDDMPTLVSVQAEGCSPICEAHSAGNKEIERWVKPKTIASAIANPLPPGGNHVLRKLEEYDGICESVSDKDIIKAQNEIAREGIFCQPASAVSVAALKNLRSKSRIEEGSDVVSIITGSGLKSEVVFDTEQTTSHCDLEDLGTCLERFF